MSRHSAAGHNSPHAQHLNFGTLHFLLSALHDISLPQLSATSPDIWPNQVCLRHHQVRNSTPLRCPTGRMIQFAMPILLLLILNIISEASEAPAGHAKRYPPAQSDAQTAASRRDNAFGTQPLSAFSRLSQLVGTSRVHKSNADGKRDPRLGPGPGRDAEIAARNREKRRAAAVQSLHKRQGSAETNFNTVSNTETPSLSSSAAQATSTMNASHPTWIPSDTYYGSIFWKYGAYTHVSLAGLAYDRRSFSYFQFFTDVDPTHGTVT